MLGVAGMESVSPAGPLTPVILQGERAVPRLRPYAGLMRSLPEIDAAAMGHGLLRADPDLDGIVPRTPLLARKASARVN